MLPEQERVHRLRDAVLEYLEAHPEAADSVTGIQQWWLPARRVDVDVSDLQAALDSLVEQGHVRRAVLADGTQVYSRGGPARRLS